MPRCIIRTLGGAIAIVLLLLVCLMLPLAVSLPLLSFMEVAGITILSRRRKS